MVEGEGCERGGHGQGTLLCEAQAVICYQCLLRADNRVPLQNGRTALHYASRYGQLETVEWLVESGGSSVRAIDQVWCAAL